MEMYVSFLHLNQYFRNKFWFLKILRSDNTWYNSNILITYQCLYMVYYGIFLVDNKFFQKFHLILFQSSVFFEGTCRSVTGESFTVFMKDGMRSRTKLTIIKLFDNFSFLMVKRVILGYEGLGC